MKPTQTVLTPTLFSYASCKLHRNVKKKIKNCHRSLVPLLSLCTEDAVIIPLRHGANSIAFRRWYGLIFSTPVRKLSRFFFLVALFGICCGHVPGPQKVLGGHRESFGREKIAERSFGLEVSDPKPPNFFRFSFAVLCSTTRNVTNHMIS